jgi:hypothetical protein
MNQEMEELCLYDKDSDDDWRVMQDKDEGECQQAGFHQIGRITGQSLGYSDMISGSG